jgi:hypothetical protein
MDHETLKWCLKTLSVVVVVIGCLTALYVAFIPFAQPTNEMSNALFIRFTAALFLGLGVVSFAGLFAAIGYAAAELLDVADTIRVPRSDSSEEDAPAATSPMWTESRPSETGKRGTVVVYKRYVEQAQNVRIESGEEGGEAHSPLKLARTGDDAPSGEEEASEFSCPWCVQRYEVAAGKNATFRCAKCNNEVLVTFT